MAEYSPLLLTPRLCFVLPVVYPAASVFLCHPGNEQPKLQKLGTFLVCHVSMSRVVNLKPLPLAVFCLQGIELFHCWWIYTDTRKAYSHAIQRADENSWNKMSNTRRAALNMEMASCSLKHGCKCVNSCIYLGSWQLFDVRVELNWTAKRTVLHSIS